MSVLRKANGFPSHHRKRCTRSDTSQTVLATLSHHRPIGKNIPGDDRNTSLLPGRAVVISTWILLRSRRGIEVHRMEEVPPRCPHKLYINSGTRNRLISRNEWGAQFGGRCLVKRSAGSEDSRFLDRSGSWMYSHRRALYAATEEILTISFKEFPRVYRPTTSVPTEDRHREDKPGCAIDQLATGGSGRHTRERAQQRSRV